MVDAGSEPVVNAAPLSPYHAARWARDRHVEELENRIRYLRALIFILVAVTAIGVHGAVTLARQSRIVPYIVEVDRLGQTRAIGRVEEVPPPAERHIRRDLARFVEAMRTVTTDPVAQNALIDRSFTFTRGPARSYVDEYFSVPGNSPHAISRHLIRRVNVRTVRRMAGSANTWEIGWEESEVPLRGGTATVRAWQGTARTAVIPPKDEPDLLANEFSIYITDLSWAPIGEGEKIDLRDARGAMDAAADQRLREAWSAERAPRPDSASPTP